MLPLQPPEGQFVIDDHIMMFSPPANAIDGHWFFQNTATLSFIDPVGHLDHAALFNVYTP